MQYCFAILQKERFDKLSAKKYDSFRFRCPGGVDELIDYPLLMLEVRTLLSLKVPLFYPEA